MKESQFANRIKLITVGNAGVGKSCLIKRYCEHRFISKYCATVGVDFGSTRVNVASDVVNLNIFDLSGHPLFYEVRTELYTNVQAILLVYDVSNQQSCAALSGWMDELQLNSPSSSELNRVMMVVCGNKVDLLPKQSHNDKGKAWALARGLPFFYVSALDGSNLDDMFKTLLIGATAKINGTFDSTHDGGIDSANKRSCGVATSAEATEEQLLAASQLNNGRNNFERLGLKPNASCDEINRAYRRLAVLLHPDKTVFPGSLDAFKLLVEAKATLLP